MQSEVELGFTNHFTFGGHKATVASDVLTVVNKKERVWALTKC